MASVNFFGTVAVETGGFTGAGAALGIPASIRASAAASLASF